MQFFLLSLLINNQQNNNRKQGGEKMSSAEIILREAEKLPWDEWQRIVKAMEFTHREGADKPILGDSKETHDKLMIHVEYY